MSRGQSRAKDLMLFAPSRISGSALQIHEVSRAPDFVVASRFCASPLLACLLADSAAYSFCDSPLLAARRLAHCPRNMQADKR